MRGLTRASAVVALAVVLVGRAASTAHAQTREDDAERLFREGQKLMEERKYGEACPKFEAAYKKDGALGTLINLAFCHKEQGANWYAWLEFREAEVKAAGLKDRRDFAHARLTELEKGLPKVVIDNPQKVALTEVLVEDRKVWEAEGGLPFAAEGGKRKFTFRAKGKKAATTIIMVSRGTSPQHVAIPEMADLTPDDLPPPPVAPIDPPKRDAATPPPSTSSGFPQRTLGWVAIGVGGAAAAFGIVAGTRVLFGPCRNHGCQAASRSRELAGYETVATIAPIADVVGGVLIAGGIVLLLTAPASGSAGSSSAQPSVEGPRATHVVLAPSVGPTWAGLSGTF